MRNKIVALLAMLVLSSCADEVPAQQNTAPQSAVARPPPMPNRYERFRRRAVPVPTDKPVPTDTEETDEATKKIDEITERLEYLRRYIGPPKQ